MRKIDYLFLVLVLVVGVATGITVRKISDDRIHADIEENQPQVQSFIGKIVVNGNMYQLVLPGNARFDLIANDPSLQFGVYLNQNVKILAQRKNDTNLVVTGITKL